MAATATGRVGRAMRAYTRVKEVVDGQVRYVKRSLAEGQTGIRPAMVGNHKMNLTVTEASGLLGDLLDKLGATSLVDVVLAPSALNLVPMRRQLKEQENELTYEKRIKDGFAYLSFAAQAIHWEDFGAHTGEVSANQVREAGAKFVLIGHSERRQGRGETDLQINEMMSAAFWAGLRPILCVGEPADVRDKGGYLEYIKDQVVKALGLNSVEDAAFTRVTAEQIPLVTIAYEPIWAIGKGRAPATPEQAEEVHAYIRRIIEIEYNEEREYGEEVALRMRILYGGNVSPDNIADFMAMNNVDGALVGGASLDADRFARIVRFGLDK